MKKRFLFSKLQAHLTKKQIILIVGSRQVGKTTIMQQLNNEIKSQSKTTFFITLEDPQIKKSFNSHPEKLFEYLPPLNKNQKNYIFIDEIQYLDNPSNFLKYIYDKYHSYIKLIVSGSSSFYIDKNFKDSLAGRKRLFNLATLSFDEFLLFKDREDIIPYINSGNMPDIYKNELNKFLYEYLIYGAYPEVVTETNIEEKKAIIKELANSYIKKDIIDSNLQYPDLYFQIFQIISNQIGSLFNKNTLSEILQKSNQTIDSYLNVMKKSFHITEIKPFYRNISKEIRKMPKLYFNDLGLRNYFAKNFNPIGKRKDKGQLFENFVFRRFYDKYDEMDIQFWRTQKMQEIDFIIDKKSAYEVKFSEENINLKKYNYFIEKYPEISLKLINFNNVNEIKLSQS
ncbi:MAG: ATP-binding protein [Bacteroidales bacterium]|nr:ATP-binding protein [Bacteroidales bacterium]